MSRFTYSPPRSTSLPSRENTNNRGAGSNNDDRLISSGRGSRLQRLAPPPTRESRLGLGASQPRSSGRSARGNLIDVIDEVLDMVDETDLFADADLATQQSSPSSSTCPTSDPPHDLPGDGSRRRSHGESRGDHN